MRKKVNKTHNGIISFWKFMFSIMVIIFHSTERLPNPKFFMYYGRIAVEFFFLVSGYLMAKTALNENQNTTDIAKDTIQYIWKKIKAFFPYILISFILCFIVKNNINRKFTASEIANSIWNLFLLEMSGLNSPSINGMTWYISSMLISMLILYPLLKKYKKNFTHIIAPTIVFFVGGWLAYQQGNFADPYIWMGITYKGVFRGFFELSLGTILYELAQKLKTVEFTFLGKLLLTIIETIGFISVFFIVNVPNASNDYDFVMLAILSVSVTLAFSENNIFYHLANNKVFYYLEKLTLPMFLNHNWVIILVVKFARNASYSLQLVGIITYTIAFSMLNVMLIEKLRKIDKSNFKRLFIKN